MYTGIVAMWLGKRFIASIKADNGWIKQNNNDYVSYEGVKGSVSLN